jgi:PAS domain S-box-containing protein
MDRSGAGVRPALLAITYVVVSIAWIGFSDRVVAALVTDPSSVLAFQTAKGWLFVLATGSLLYVFTRRWLREANAAAKRLTTIVNASPLPIVILDLEGRVELWNPAAERVFGWTAAEVLGGPAPGSDAPDKDPTRYISRVLQGERVVGAEMRRERRDGTLADVWVSAAPLLDDDGTAKGVVAILEDITAIKESEREQLHLSRAIEQSAEAVVITDIDGSIRYVNPAFERISGYTRAEVFGRNPRLLKSGVQDPEFYRHMWETLQRGETWQARFTNRRKDGREYKQDSIISPVRNADGSVVSYVAVARDVTRELELEAQLRQSQKLEAVGQLTGGIAHDFNNLLTVIAANAELLTHGGEQDRAEVLRAADEMRQAALRGAELVRKLLGFSRRAQLDLAPTDLGKVVTETATMLRRTIPEDIRIETVSDPGVGLVSADPGALQQILMNLATNARDAMPKGGTLRFEVCAASPGHELVRRYGLLATGRNALITVQDTGTGMTPDVAARVFEPFFTTKPPGKGTGLGLAMVYGLVRQHEGSVAIHSEPGSGTTVLITLPVTEPRATGSAGKPHPGGARGNGELVLVAEDEEGLRVATVRVLTRLGYSAIAASNGREALELFRTRRGEIRLVLTDLIMPEMGGGELAAAIREFPDAPPILFSSGYGDRDVEERAAIGDKARLLPKPWTIEDLSRRVQEALNGG